MPRCPNGTRKNKATLQCEKLATNETPKKSVSSTKKKQDALVKKYNTCLAKLRKVGPIENISQLRKHTDLIQECQKIHDEIDNLDTTKKLSESDVQIIMQNNIYDIFGDKNKNEIYSPKEIEEIENKLRNLTYDKDYVCAFTGKKADNLFHMASDKLQAFVKYGDEM